jgi:hypothetical protein
MIIGFVGLIGTGKDTAADYLINSHGFVRDSFASALKDAVSVVFGWDRQLLEGRTAESRAWREQVDPWWSQRLQMPELTPRWVLQHWGTNLCREAFHNDIWIAALENRLRSNKNNIVITDVRFPNEIAAIRNIGGRIYWIQRGQLPEWYDCALLENSTSWDQQWLLEDANQLMEQKYPNVHNSEWAWIGQIWDGIVTNNTSVDDLYAQLKNLVQDHLAAS